MSLATFREVLATIVLLVTVGLLIVSIWAAYSRFKGASEPADRSKHRCHHCSKEFPCRAEQPKTILDSQGRIITTASIAKQENSDEQVLTRETYVPTGAAKPVGALPVDPSNGRTLLRRRTPAAATAASGDKVAATVDRRARAGNVNSFQRRTVHVGSFPIEVSEPANKTCCAVYLSAEKPAERFCSFQCYRAMLNPTR